MDSTTYEKTLSICAVFKNEARFLSEWIEYHKLVGVEKFWLYNNNSEDNYRTVLAPYIKKGDVHLIEWPFKVFENEWDNHGKMQIAAYTDCINHLRGKSKWLALIDIDEFIFPVEEDNLAILLEREFNDVLGLVINWVMFGTSGIKKILSNELLISKLTKRAPINYNLNLTVKSIVQPKFVVDCINAHYCNYLPNCFHLNTNRQKIKNITCNSSDYLCIDKIRLHHYWAKDEEFFRKVKLPRYQNWGSTMEKIIAEKNKLNIEEDLSMIRFVEPLDKRMKKRKLNIISSCISWIKNIRKICY